MSHREDIAIAKEVLSVAKMLAAEGYVVEAKSFLDFFKKKPASQPAKQAPPDKSPAPKSEPKSAPGQQLPPDRLKEFHRHFVRDKFGKLLNSLRDNYVAKKTPLSDEEYRKMQTQIIQMFTDAAERGGFKDKNKMVKLGHDTARLVYLRLLQLQGKDAEKNRKDIMDDIKDELQAISTYLAKSRRK